MKNIIRSFFAIALFLMFSSALYAQPIYEWVKGINSAQWSQNIARDARGNIYLTGLFGSSSDFDPGPGNATITTGERDYYFAKYDPNGNYIFAFPILVSGGSEIQIAVDQSSNIYLTGFLNQAGNSQNIDFDPGPGEAFLPTGDGKIFVAKYDSSGNYLWAFALDSADNYIYGSADATRKLAVDRFGNVYLTGHFFGSVDFDPGTNEAKLVSDSLDIFLAKYDTYGNYLWARKAGGKGSDGALNIVVDKSGSAYITGWSEGFATFDSKSEGGSLADTSTNFFFAKYDSTGKFEWVKAIRRYDNYNYSGLIALDSIGNIYFSSNFDSTIDVDPGSGVYHLPDEGRFIGKYTNEGKLIWARSIGRPQINDLEVGQSNNLYVAGVFNATNYFDPGNIFSKLTSLNYNVDMFIAKYDLAGKYQWAMHCGSADTSGYLPGCVLESMTVDPAENIYVAGWFGGATDFDPGPGVASIAPFLSRDIFFAKYSQVKSSVQSWPENISGITIFPNPSTGLLRLHGTLAMPEKLDVKIFNILGAEVLHQTFDAPSEFSMQMDVSKLLAGIYTVQITSPEGRRDVQFVKE